MAESDAFSEFERALERLDELRRSVARQTDAGAVFDAVQSLQLAVARSYGGRRPRAPSGCGALRRILEHLQQHLGEWISGEELAAVSGIGEWARRVRELRLEQGYCIEEQDGSYRLVSIEPDADAARRWQLLSTIRRSGGTPKERVLALLSDTIGVAVPGSELSYVAGGRDAIGLVHELRDVDGLPIDSATDSRDLQADGFRLLSLAPEDSRDDRQHLFPEVVRAAVFHRDNYSCWRCRRDRDAASVGGGGVFYLTIHHLHADAETLDRLSLGELADPAALATYCQSCLLGERSSARRRRRQTDSPPSANC